MALLNPLWAVRLFFIIALLVLFIPSKLMMLTHGVNFSRFLGASASTLLICWALYRLCICARFHAWFITISIPAVYVAVFVAPIYAWVVLLILFLVHRWAFRYLDDPRAESLPPPRPTSTEELGDAIIQDHSWVAHKFSIQVVNLDDLCKAYRRILFSQRIIRAMTASAASVVLAVPIVPFFSIWDSEIPISAGLVFAVLFVVFMSSVATAYFWWLRALWRGSVRAGYIGLLFASIFGAILTYSAVVGINGELFVTGEIWFHVTAYVLALGPLGVIAMGSAIVVRRQHEVALMGLLRQNASHDWRDAVLKLTGLVTPARRSLAALTHKSVVLSLLAFCIEGSAFYVYFKAPDRFLRASQLLTTLPFSGSPTPLEGHYFSIVTIATFILPAIYISTQVTLKASERIRYAAMRASLRSFDDLLNEDPRPTVLFLRNFKDDQVTLDRLAMPGWIRVLDPGGAQANLEGVLQGCLSIGPVVAIGRPEDVKPPVGAVRRYIQGEDWRGAVLSMMEAAALVVVGASESAGVTWEIHQLRNHGHLGKSVFVIPPIEQGNHRLVWYLVSQLLAPAEQFQRNVIAAELTHAIRSRQIAGVTLHHGILKVFVTDRRPSQVEFDVTLRLALATAEEAR